MPDKQSRMMLRSTISAAGTSTLISTTFSDVNSTISAEDFVACGNALGSCCRYEPDVIRRIDVLDYAPDEFDG